MERTVVIIKPDGVVRGLAGKIITRFEEKGLDIKLIFKGLIPLEVSKQHYIEHEGKEHYEKICNFLSSGPCVILVVYGENIVETIRKMVGNTYPSVAEVGTIRHDFAVSVPNNVIHASDSVEAAEREYKLYFEHLERK